MSDTPEWDKMEADCREANRRVARLEKLMELADAMYSANDAGEGDDYGAFSNYYRERWPDLTPEPDGKLEA